MVTTAALYASRPWLCIASDGLTSILRYCCPAFPSIFAGVFCCAPGMARSALTGAVPVQLQAGEVPHGFDFVQGIFHGRIAEVIEQLHAVDSQHSG